MDAINVTTSGRIPSDTIKNSISLKPGEPYNPIQLNRELSGLVMTGDFSDISQQLVQEDGKNVVNIVAHEKAWGRHFFLFGFGISNTFDGEGSYNVQVGHRYPWITASGLEWRNDVMLGSYRARWHSELRQPLPEQGFYLAPYFAYDRKRADIYTDDDPRPDTLPRTAYNIEIAMAGLDVGLPLGRLGIVRAGAGYQQTTYSPRYSLGIDSLRPLRQRQPFARVDMVIDQLDDALFPRHGYYLYGRIKHGYGNDEVRFGDAHAKALLALNSGRHTYNFALEAAGAYTGDSLGDGMGFTLGGFQRLSAYATDEFAGNYLLYGRATYLYNSPDITLPGLEDVVIGTSLEVGNVWQERPHFGHGPYKTSASVFIGGKSVVGPLYLGVATARYGIWNVYLQFGRVF